MSKLREKLANVKLAEETDIFYGRDVCPVSYDQLMQDIGEAIKYQIMLVIDAKQYDDNPDEILQLVYDKFTNSGYGSHSIPTYMTTICVILDSYYKRGKNYFL